MTNNIINPQVIKDLAPKDLVYNFLAGIQKNHKLYLGVMFDVEEADPLLSHGTGKLYIADIDERAPFCKLLRNSSISGINEICRNFTLKCFNEVKTKCLKFQDYKGQIFSCKPGNLLCFSVPIVERERNSFIGVIFGGQKRLRENPRQTKTNFNNLINENDILKNIPRSKLYKAFSQVDQVSNDEFAQMKKLADSIADDLVKRFEYYVKERVRDEEAKLQQEVIKRAYASIIDAQDMNKFRECFQLIPEIIQPWMLFDWCIILEPVPDKISSYVYRVTKTIGRGLGPTSKLVNKQWEFPAKNNHELVKSQLNPGFLSDYLNSLIPTGNEYWWVPLVRNDRIYASYILGSLKTHHGSSWDNQSITGKVITLEEITSRLALKLDILLALENESDQRKEAELNKVQAIKASESMQDTVLALTHQLKRPLIMVQQALSNVRDLINIASIDDLTQDVELGRLAAKHSEILCRGISKILAVEGGGRFDHSPVKINVKKELMDLCQAMERLSGREHLSFRFFDQSPTIMMDRDSFVYVFYALVDNAIKYSDSNTVIELICDEERSTSRYAFKIKSYGMPIPPEQKNMIFQKFWRGPNARNFDDTGIGLGCWAAKRHMELHGGRLDVEVQGKLTIFIIYPAEIK